MTGEPLAHPGYFHDRATGITCYPHSVMGGLRCVDVNAAGLSSNFGFYSDANCQQEIVGSDGCTVPVVALRLGTPCGDYTAAFRVGAKLNLNSYYSRYSGGSCLQHQVTTQVFYSLAPLDPTTLPAVTERVE